MEYYWDNFIFRSCDTGSIHEQFIDINHYYEDMLSKSIKTLEENLILRKQKEIFYNYVLIDANAFVCLLKDISHKKEPSIDDLVFFKSIIIYVGKGCRLRKSSHLTDSYKILTGSMENGELPKRLKKILENAMIQSAGSNLTNLIKGAAYGAMKNTWTKKEILLYGDMLLFFALKKCINDKPISILPSDMISSEISKLNIRTKYELQGVLEYFLEI